MFSQDLIDNLKRNKFAVAVVDTKEQALAEFKTLVPVGSSVMLMSSITLEETGVVDLVNNSGNYTSVKSELSKMDRATQGQRMRELGSAPQVAVGSLQAITESGQLVFASNSGSQLPAYAYGAEKVVLVVGAQKIVKDLDAAFARIKDVAFPLENVRAQKAYGVNSAINKLLIINSDNTPNRISLILVAEKFGY